jgi:uncharacterized protein YbjT (DUF2867 family)
VASDIGKASAAILVNPEPYANKTLKVATTSTTHADLAKALSQSLGREIKHIRVPYSWAREVLLKKGLPEWEVDRREEMYKLLDSGSPFTNDPEGAVVFKTITGQDPVSLEQWVATVADEFK